MVDDQVSIAQAAGPSGIDAGFKPARFVVELGLPPAEESLLSDAKSAVRQEFRDCSKWKRLRCRKVSIIAEKGRGTIYALHVGSSVEFDWTWEGATAFRPQAVPDDGDGRVDMADFEDSPVEESSLWSGEVLEVDERSGCLFISLTNPENPPTVGSFFVRPFDFLGVLDAIYHEPRFELIHEELRRRLAATAGGIHPPVAQAEMVGLPKLRDWWQHSWSVLWGPPGTGKTYTTGQQIAGVLLDKHERVLVVSTTNRATDAVALSIGRAARVESNAALEAGELLRIGKGASFQAFRDASLEPMLRGTETEILSQIDGLAQQLPLFDAWEDKALTRKQITELRTNGNDQSKRIFVDPAVRVVVATAFKATSYLDHDLIRKMIEEGEAPFTTIFIDEAGLISRAAVAALSLLASRRIVLVGDSKQLAPISRISRILPTRQETWLANSGVSHLNNIEATPTAVHVLSEQHRMHPDVCKVVSDFQYGGVLTTALETSRRESKLPRLLAKDSRAIWYVLDEEDTDLASIRAERGPGNRSWVRGVTLGILSKLFHDPVMRQSQGLFISPYKAQANAVSKWLAAEGISSWEASTVHSQQGSEADIVVFDTVNAGSCNWPPDEWKRLINVGLSRAKEAVILLASRNEMEEPHLRPLLASMSPRVLSRRGGQDQWETVSTARPKAKATTSPDSPNNLGGQIAKRQSMQPVLSHEQQRLSNLELDGKPRLVRGVAGSGKTLVLSNWLAKTAKRLAKEQDVRIWAVYANRSLHKLLRESIEAAWQGSGNNVMFPWEKVSLLHVKDVLAGILPSVSLSMDNFEFEYDRAAEEFLNRQEEATMLPRCQALFIDEAQDMGPNTLRLLLSLVEQTDADDRNSRSAHIFFDNAQNIYGRKTPKWSEFGLDMRGRSTILKESFRSTNPITELAVNLLHRLTPDVDLHDHNELVSLGLIERTQRNGQEWLQVRFNQVHGPKPIFRRFDNRDLEMAALGNHIAHLVTKEGVAAADICLIYNGKSVIRLLETKLAPRLSKIGIELSVQTNRPFERQPNTLLVTTSHSYKGYDAEVVLIPCSDQYTTQDGQVLAANLYVAMTRARSWLGIYSLNSNDSAVSRLNDAIESCVETLSTPAAVDLTSSKQDDFLELLERIGSEHRKWLLSLWNEFGITQEPIFDERGKLIAQPLFWLTREGQRHACFPPGDLHANADETLRQHGILRLSIGELL
ncbi:AAA domain-containing protein [Anatilimnocola floriformis]|uniref:AAA domain-containing protein n=1 Tax=Anatilimnocola floriformis TaxID=2948575 RepID=UPI0020C3A9FC|nr:AAA domain-containing protein [Anatilimnocola floriformis]